MGKGLSGKGIVHEGNAGGAWVLGRFRLFADLDSIKKFGKLVSAKFLHPLKFHKSGRFANERENKVFLNSSIIQYSAI